jgi:hypothetical protein
MASCWRWSELSIEDAQRQADQRAAELARLLAAGTPLDRYGYGERALREEIIQTIAGDGQTNVAVVTRNAYGALVLNAARAMFIDVDFPAHSTAAAVGDLFRRVISGTVHPDAEQHGLQKIQQWAAQQSALALRVYRTAAGLRCLVTNRTFDVTQPETINLLRSSGSDPLYVRLCKAQACFRARLTPKPWRLHLHVPPVGYPRPDAAAESQFHRWQTDYEHSSRGHCVCRFLTQIGSGEVHPEIRPILELHDHLSCSKAEFPLA